MSPGLLNAEQVRVRYGNTEVLSDVSLSVQPGELWVVLGPNGAGKSTLLKACLGLLPLVPGAGSVSVLGKALGGWDRRALARTVAWVPQTSEMGAGFSVLEVVLMGRMPGSAGSSFGLQLSSREDVQAARAVLEELGAGGLADRAVNALSGGEQRLVLLARALVQEPQLLLLDEPTAFLDLRHQVSVLARVQARVRKGLGAVAVLHDVNLAAAFADRVLMLRGGKVLAQGDAQSLFRVEPLEELYGLPMTGVVGEGGQPLFAPRQVK